MCVCSVMDVFLENFDRSTLETAWRRDAEDLMVWLKDLGACLAYFMSALMKPDVWIIWLWYEPRTSWVQDDAVSLDMRAFCYHHLSS